MPKPPTAALNHEALTAIREKDGLSQAELAKLAGVARSVVCEMEQGKRQGSPRVRKAIAQALRVPLSAIENRIAS